jgi:hypothetical protein
MTPILRSSERCANRTANPPPWRAARPEQERVWGCLASGPRGTLRLFEVADPVPSKPDHGGEVRSINTADPVPVTAERRIAGVDLGDARLQDTIPDRADRYRTSQAGIRAALGYAVGFPTGTEAEMFISAEWYVLVTSASGETVFATMGPYQTEADAVNAADVGRVVHYRVGVRSDSPVAPISNR